MKWLSQLARRNKRMHVVEDSVGMTIIGCAGLALFAGIGLAAMLALSWLI